MIIAGYILFYYKVFLYLPCRPAINHDVQSALKAIALGTVKIGSHEVKRENADVEKKHNLHQVSRFLTKLYVCTQAKCNYLH